MYLSPETLNGTADWHGNQAVKAFRRRDYDAYKRHIDRHDELRQQAAEMFGEDPQ
jgi:hypothetical protein